MTFKHSPILLALASLTACAQMATAFRPTPPPPDVPPAPPITAELHRANLGKIVFANAKIESEAGSAALINRASLSDIVEVRAFFTTTPAQALLAKSGKECTGGSTRLMWEMRDAKDAEWTELSEMFLGQPLADTWVTTEIEPLWGPERVWPRIWRTDQILSPFLHAKQAAGSIAFELRVNVSCELEEGGTVVAEMSSGSLAVELDPESVRAYAARTFKTQPHQFAHAADFRNIEAEARRAWGTKDAKVLWVRVPQREWTIIRGRLGEISFRGATVTTAIRTGDQCAIKTAIAREDAIGGGRFVDVPTLVDATNELPETTKMPCSAL